MSSPNQATIKYNGILYYTEAECIIARDGYMSAYHSKDQQYKDKITTDSFTAVKAKKEKPKAPSKNDR